MSWWDSAGQQGSSDLPGQDPLPCTNLEVDFSLGGISRHEYGASVCIVHS